ARVREATALLTLVSGGAAKLEGANLHKMIFAIENGMADFIQEFDPERWQKPTAADAPLIDSIEVRITDSGSRYEDMKH
ncbi:MAG: hypothetical protein ABSF34_18835, partial [Verrucomicrobiota bacterium]